MKLLFVTHTYLIIIHLYIGTRRLAKVGGGGGGAAGEWKND